MISLNGRIWTIKYQQKLKVLNLFKILAVVWGMTKEHRYLTLASDARKQSTMKIKVGAVLVRGSRVIKLAHNTMGKSRTNSWSRHAEVRATINVNAEGCTIYIAREHGTLGSPMLAKPCHNCFEWLDYVGIKEVEFTISQYPFYQSY